MYKAVTYQTSEAHVVSSTAALLRQQTIELRTLLGSGLSADLSPVASPCPLDDDTSDDGDAEFDPNADNAGDVTILGSSGDGYDSDLDDSILGNGSTYDSEEEDDIRKQELNEEYALEHMSDRKLEREEDNSWRAEVQPIVDFVLAGG